MREMLREVFGKERRATAGYFQFANYSYLLGAAVFTSMSNFAVYVILREMEGFPLPLKILAMIGQILFSAFVIYLAFGFANYNFYVKPMRVVAQAARKVAEGDFTVRLDEAPEGGEKNEFSVLAEDFNTMVRELAGRSGDQHPEAEQAGEPGDLSGGVQLRPGRTAAGGGSGFGDAVGRKRIGAGH